MASKSKILAELFEADGDIIASALDNVVVSPTAVSDKPNTSTGGFSMPAGTTAQRPGSPDTGESRYNSTTGSLEFYDGASWIATNLIPSINSVTGTIYAGIASNLTLNIASATETITVRFKEGSSIVEDVANITVSSGSATVAVPSTVYGQTAGDTINVSILNQDGTPSSNGVNKSVQGLPTGGTISNSGAYRVHTFTSSSNFVVPSGLTLSNVEYVVVAGGGSGGQGNGGGAGGGGGGGYRSSVVSESSGGGASAESRLTLVAGSYTATVGAGAPAVNGTKGATGSNSVFGTITSLGGGGGGNQQQPTSGGSGGGGAEVGSVTGASGTSGQGYKGGDGYNSAPNGGGAGGGAGQAPAATTSSAPANGGNGVQSSINGSATYRAAGGGASQNSRAGSSGGNGGGGNGGPGSGGTGTVTSGAVNTGGGGGGTYTSGAGGATGGSGIIIVRYQL